MRLLQSLPVGGSNAPEGCFLISIKQVGEENDKQAIDLTL